MNSILYLEMTDNHSPPTLKDEFLPIGDNWVKEIDPNNDGIAAMGTYVLAKQNFMESWFVPKVKKLNRMMSARFDGHWFHFESYANGVRKWTFNHPLLIGDGCSSYSKPDSKDDEFKMTFSMDPPAKFDELMTETELPDVLPLVEKGALCWYQYQAPPHDWLRREDFGDKGDSYTLCMLSCFSIKFVC
jgi:hypothetical protein